MNISEHGTVVVPELEEEVKASPWREWTEEEDAVVRSYFNRITRAALLRYLEKMCPPGRKRTALDNRAKELGLKT